MFAKGHIRGYPLFKKWTLDIILTRGIPWENGLSGKCIGMMSRYEEDACMLRYEEDACMFSSQYGRDAVESV